MESSDTHQAGAVATNISNSDILKNIYYDLENPASFSTAPKIYEAVGRKISLEEIEDWLSGQLTYTLHKPRRVNFKRNYYNLDNFNTQWQADLMDLVSLSSENNGYRYILLVIDAFSRIVRVRPLKTKSAKEVLEAFKSIVEEAKTAPYQLVTDRGKEFFNNLMKNYLKTIETKHFAPSSDTFKAAFAERAIRSYKNILFKFLTSNLTFRYLEFVQKIADTMNSRIHSSINMAPKDVCDDNILDVWRFVQTQRNKKKQPKVSKPDINVGDYVRAAKNKNTAAMDKGFLPNYTDEIFKVVSSIPRKPRVYKLIDCNNQPIEGVWYRAELVKVKKDEYTLYRIEKILKRRRRKGIAELYVKWKGHSSAHNSWIPASDIVQNE